VTKNGIDGNFALAFISLVGDDMVSWNGYMIATRRERFERVVSELRSSECSCCLTKLGTSFNPPYTFYCSFARMSGPDFGQNININNPPTIFRGKV
jgi:hypothetical protein